MPRADYAFPFHIDAVSGQAARTGYADHVRQMIRQLLLTDPGERADLPEFGCGLRRLLFAPNADLSAAEGGAGPRDALHATTQLLVREAVERWLAGQVRVQDVLVTREPDAGEIRITLLYQLIETLSTQQVDLLVTQ